MSPVVKLYDVAGLVVVFALVVCAIWIVDLLSGCGAADLTCYRGTQEACIRAYAPDKDKIDECRHTVQQTYNAKWDREHPDAGGNSDGH